MDYSLSCNPVCGGINRFPCTHFFCVVMYEARSILAVLMISLTGVSSEVDVCKKSGEINPLSFYISQL